MSFAQALPCRFDGLISAYYSTHDYLLFYYILIISHLIVNNKSLHYTPIKCTMMSIVNAISAPPINCSGVCLLVYALEIKTGIANSAQIIAVI